MITEEIMSKSKEKGKGENQAIIQMLLMTLPYACAGQLTIHRWR